jgi:formylglycine-generating enzyme required for sulfatase activity
MVVILAVSFSMGSPAGEPGRDRSEGPQHVVSFTRPFAVGKFAVMVDHSPLSSAKADTTRARGVGLSKTARRFIFGDDEGAMCRHNNWADWGAKRSRSFPKYKTFLACDDAYAYAASVGSFPPNGFGLHDMLGNVWEWMEDCWKDNHRGAPTRGPAWTLGTVISVCLALALGTTFRVNCARRQVVRQLGS